MSHTTNVAAALCRWHAFASREGLELELTCVGLDSYAEHLVAKGLAPISAASYPDRVVSGFRIVISPQRPWAHMAIVLDRWKALAGSAPARKNKTSRIVPASRLNGLGDELVAEAREAPMRGLRQARDFRNGVLLIVGTSLPERARALSSLAFDTTLMLRSPDEVEFALPGSALKLRERKKVRGGYQAVLKDRDLHDVLEEYRRDFRPIFDEGSWLFPSTHDRRRPVSESSLGQICGDVTERRLGGRVNLHLLRDCVATEAVEEMPFGASLAAPFLRHKDPCVTARHYDLATSVSSARHLSEAMARRSSRTKQDLKL